MPATSRRERTVVPRQTGRSGTSARILDAAERVVQTRGFASFSYASVAAELHITKAALHYHYPGKAELGLALISRYAARFAGALAAIDASAKSAPAKLEGYIDLYADVLGEQKMCLCGMLAAEFETLTPPMRAEVVRFFGANERWLEAVVEQGAGEHSMRGTGDARATAILILSALEGAMLVARPCGDPGKFRAVAAALLAGLTGQPAGPPGLPAGPAGLTGLPAGLTGLPAQASSDAPRARPARP
ncbi:MAG: TetR/AcrR family transcriptional regulator [Streptosporangiaceae bacterium]